MVVNFNSCDYLKFHRLSTHPFRNICSHFSERGGNKWVGTLYTTSCKSKRMYNRIEAEQRFSKAICLFFLEGGGGEITEIVEFFGWHEERHGHWLWIAQSFELSVRWHILVTTVSMSTGTNSGTRTRMCRTQSRIWHLRNLSVTHTRHRAIFWFVGCDPEPLKEKPCGYVPWWCRWTGYQRPQEGTNLVAAAAVTTFVHERCQSRYAWTFVPCKHGGHDLSHGTQ